MEYKDLDNRIAELESAVNRLPQGTVASCWSLVKEVGAGFKGIRYPSRQSHESAWARFQGIVDRLKEFANSRSADSERVRDRLLTIVEGSLPGSGLSDFIGLPIAMAEDATRHLFGMRPADHWREQLQSCSARWKDALDEYKRSKGMMLPRDSGQVRDALTAAREKLDHAWEQYRVARGERREQAEQRRQERDEKRKAWREKQGEFVQRLRGALVKQREYLERKNEQLKELEEKRDDAWNDSFRERVGGWIDECETKIREVEESIRSLEQKIDEAEAQLGHD